jgi:hypothetical protein
MWASAAFTPRFAIMFLPVMLLDVYSPLATRLVLRAT